MTAVLEVASRGRIPPFLRDDAVRIVGEEPLDDIFWQPTVGLSKLEVRMLLRDVAGMLSGGDLPAGDPTVGRREMSAAEALAEVAQMPPAASTEPVAYDTSDSKVRVRRILLRRLPRQPQQLSLLTSPRTDHHCRR